MTIRQLCAAGFIAAYRMFREAFDCPSVRNHVLTTLWRSVQDARLAYLEACA